MTLPNIFIFASRFQVHSRLILKMAVPRLIPLLFVLVIVFANGENGKQIERYWLLEDDIDAPADVLSRDQDLADIFRNERLYDETDSNIRGSREVKDPDDFTLRDTRPKKRKEVKGSKHGWYFDYKIYRKRALKLKRL